MDVKFTRPTAPTSAYARITIEFQTEIEINIFKDIVSQNLPRFGNMNEAFKRRILQALEPNE